MEQFIRSPNQLGTFIRNERRKQNLSQVELGEKTVLRQATISKIECGEGSVKFETICRVLAALDLELVGRDRTKSNAKVIEDIFS